MENFCLYNGKKIVKPDIWNITSIELSVDYASAIIQAESKSNKSEYTLDVIPLISNQYKNGIDPYTATIVNSLTGVSDWVIDSVNDQIKYFIPPTEGSNYVYQIQGKQYVGVLAACAAFYQISYAAVKVEDSKHTFNSAGTLICEAKVTRIYDSGEAVEAVRGEIYRVAVGEVGEPEEKTLPLISVANKVISNAESGDTNAQVAIISTFNNITDDILTSDYSEFFEQNKQSKQEGE